MVKPALSGRALRLAIMICGASVAVFTGVSDQLSAHPEIGWKAVLLTVGTSLVAYAKKYFEDFKLEDLPFEWRSSLPPAKPGVQPESPTVTGDL